MSTLTDFVTAAFQSARAVIGGEAISVNSGATVSAVLNEITDSQSYDDAGFSPISAFQAVVDTAEFVAIYTAGIRTYIGATVTTRSRSFRLVDITSGRTFTTLKLESISRA